MLLCRVVPLFRGWTGWGKAVQEYRDNIVEAEKDHGVHTEEELRKFYERLATITDNDRPLLPALEPMLSQPGLDPALMVARFDDCKHMSVAPEGLDMPVTGIWLEACLA